MAHGDIRNTTASAAVMNATRSMAVIAYPPIKYWIGWNESIFFLIHMCRAAPSSPDYRDQSINSNAFRQTTNNKHKIQLK